MVIEVNVELISNSSVCFDGGCRELRCTVIGDGKHFDTGSVPVRVVRGGDGNPSWGRGNDCGTGLGENVEGLLFSETTGWVDFDLVKRGAIGVLLCLVVVSPRGVDEVELISSDAGIIEPSVGGEASRFSEGISGVAEGDGLGFRIGGSREEDDIFFVWILGISDEHVFAGFCESKVCFQARICLVGHVDDLEAAELVKEKNGVSADLPDVGLLHLGGRGARGLDCVGGYNRGQVGDSGGGGRLEGCADGCA